MSLPDSVEERLCYEAFYDATSKGSLSFQTCAVCAREKLTRDGERSFLLSDQSVVDVLSASASGDGDFQGSKESLLEEHKILRHLLQIDEGGVSCWLCWECTRALEQHTMPKFALANNLAIGDVPVELMNLTIPEQMLIARHYPRCYIFKLFPRDMDTRISLDQLYSGMAGNATLFELNTQEVVEMLEGQRMPSSIRTLASIIAITFVGGRHLPKDWLKKTFRVRRLVVYEALVWLQRHNPIYVDIKIDECRLEELPQDDVPDELLAVVRQDQDDECQDDKEDSHQIFLASNDGEEDETIGRLSEEGMWKDFVLKVESIKEITFSFYS
jgi:hypothetical protein